MYSDDDQLLKFQRIVFENTNIDNQLNQLNDSQKQRLKLSMAQKIAYQAVYKQSYPPEDIPVPRHSYSPPNFFAACCCFFYPEQNKQNFDINSSLFLRKCLHVFLFWRDDFLKLKDREDQEEVSQPDLYGPLWLTITYIILLGLTANINRYFNDKNNFTFESNFLLLAIGVQMIFELAQTLVYPAAVGCLNGQMTTIESANLMGYSLIMYFVPTFLNSVPSSTFHLILQIIGAFFRWIFLGRNYSSRVDNKKILIYAVVLAIEALHLYFILIVFYPNTKESDVQKGFDKVFHSRQFYD